MIHNISSSSESGSNSYGYTDYLDEDYAVIDGASQDGEHDGYSYSTEISDDDNLAAVDDLVLLSEVKQKLDEELTKFFAKNAEFSLPEKNTGDIKDDKMIKNNNPVDVRGASKVSTFWGKLWFLSNLLIRVVVIFVLCAQLHGMVKKNQENKGLIVPRISVESVSVFPIDLDPVSNNITAKWNVIFNVENPSKYHNLEYDHVTADVLFGEGKNPVLLFPVLKKFIHPWMPSAKSTIWKTDLPYFYQSRTEQQLVKVTFNPFPVSIDNATGAALVKHIKSGLSTAFSVRLNGSITELNCDEMDRSATFTADCGLNMAFIETGGVMASPSEECKVFRGESESWTMFAVYAGAVLHVTANTFSYLSSKYQGRRAAKSAVSHAKEL